MLTQLILLLQVCTSQLGYTPLSSRLCNTFTCNTTADCSNNGVCNATTSACQCQSGYTGPDCAISTGLCNTTATASNSSAASSNYSEICCSTGIVNSNGTCCTSGACDAARLACDAMKHAGICTYTYYSLHKSKILPRLCFGCMMGQQCELS